MRGLGSRNSMDCAVTETLEARNRRDAIARHPNFLEKQPDCDVEPIEFTHYDCWFLPADEDYTLAHLEETMLRAPRDVACQCQLTFSGWMKTLGIPLPPDGWFANLYMRGYNEFLKREGISAQDAGWAGIAEVESDAVLRVLEAGYKVYEGDGFWEVYPDFEEESPAD